MTTEKEPYVPVTPAVTSDINFLDHGLQNCLPCIPLQDEEPVLD